MQKYRLLKFFSKLFELSYEKNYTKKLVIKTAWCNMDMFMERIKSKLHSILRSSEKYTQTDMVYLAKGGWWLFILQATISSSSLIIAIAFANLITPETYGKYKFVLSFFSILSIFTLPGVNTALIRTIAQGVKVSYSKLLKTKIKWGLMSSISSISISAYYFINQNNELAISFLIISLFLPLFSSLEIYQSILNGKKDFKNLALYQIIVQAISVLIMLITVYFTKNLFVILFSYFIPITITRIFIFIKINKNHLGNENNVDIISYGKSLTMMDVLSLISAHLDKILIFTFIGSAQVAIYSFAMALPDQFKSLISKISTLALPKFAEKDISEIKKTIWKKLFIYMFFLFLASLIYILISPFIYKMFFPKYPDAIFLSQVFSISTVALAVLIPIDIMKALQKTSELYYYYTITAIIKIILLFIFVYFFGVMGAILAWVFTRFFNLIYALILLKKIIR